MGSNKSIEMKRYIKTYKQILGFIVNYTLISGILIVVLATGCKKLVNVDGPTTSLNSANIYEKDNTAAAVLTAIYSNMSAAYINSGGITSMSLFAGLSADEFTLYNNTGGAANYYYTNALNVQTGGFEFWSSSYPDLYKINAALEGISNSSTLSPSVKQQLLGEAKFLRGFYFFYLANLYGDVPLTLTTDYRVNSVMPRTSKELVWQQIITDLKEAQALLSSEYLDASLLKATSDRVRPTKWAATAMLARAYLYRKEWQNAETQASTIINNSKFSLVALDQVFKKNNKEAIWQLQPVYKGQNTQDASSFIPITEYDGDRPMLSKRLLDNFYPGDQRKTIWVNAVSFNGTTYYYPYKYKILPSADLGTPVDEYSTVLRLAEVYLIRAEARIESNKIIEGITDLNVLRDRATDDIASHIQLTKLPIEMTMPDALNAVAHERQVELFSEWGHRWLDLKRTGKVDEVMKNVVPEKSLGATWKSYQQWYPIPLGDLQLDQNLTQNAGY